MNETFWTPCYFWNADRKEVYCGISSAPRERLTSERWIGKVPALKDWDPAIHRISFEIGSVGYGTERRARDHARAMLSGRPPKGWTVVGRCGS